MAPYKDAMLINWNARSLGCKFDELKYRLQTEFSSPPILAITETHEGQRALRLKDYVVLSKPRPVRTEGRTRAAGGVAIMVPRGSRRFELGKPIDLKKVEGQTLEVVARQVALKGEAKKHIVTVICAYSPP